MSDAPDCLTDAALRALANHPPELRKSALKLLEGMVQATHPDAGAMIARWDAVDACKHRAWWRRALAVALVLLSAWVLAGAVHEAWRYKPVLWHFGYARSAALDPRADSRKAISEGANEQERFLLFGDLSQHSRSGQLRALCVSAPANPAYYAAYAFAYRSENQGSFPPDFLETVQRLDPDNAWFTYHAAGTLAHLTVERQRQASGARKAGEAPAWKIVDEEELNEALALLRTAGSQKAFVDRKKEFIAERVPLVRAHDLISCVNAAAVLPDYFGVDYDLRNLCDALAAKAWLLGEAGDAPGFKQLLGDAEAFIKTFAGMGNPTVIDVLILKLNVDRVILNLHAAAGKLGLVDEATRLGRAKERLRQWSEEHKKRLNSPECGASKMRCGLGNEGIINARNMVKSPPPLADADLKPGRMVEHLLASRACSLAVWALLGLGLLALALYRFCLPQAVLRLAQRINALLLPVDWAWMLGAGVLLPFAYVTALARCTPLGGQDWGLLKGGAAVLIAADFLTIALLLLVVPVLVARWRLGRRAAALGICAGRPLLGWLAVAVAAALVPVLGMTALPVTSLNLSLGLKLALLAPLVLVILTSLVRALAVTFTRQFSRAVVALTLIPTYASAMLLVMASLPIYQAAQSRWEQRDEMTKLTPNGFTRYECEVANEMVKEVREVLGL